MPQVNPHRRYVSPRRQSQAAATRLAVVSAARDLFVAQGYGATTIEQVAARAGVSKPTVFSAVGSKQLLLRVVRDVAIAGDDEPVPISRRPETSKIKQEPDQRRAIALLAGHLTAVAARYAGVYEALRAAASGGDDELREIWDTEEAQRVAGARFWLDVLRRKEGSAALDGDVRTTVDRLWFLMAPDHYNRFVRQRGWSERKYRQWLASAIGDLFRPGSLERAMSHKPVP